VMMSRESDTKI